jgi:hypothetical protein
VPECWKVERGGVVSVPGKRVNDTSKLWLCLTRVRITLLPSTMDALHSVLVQIQKQLAFVAVDPIDWKTYVQAFSWSVALFECYLLFVFENLLLAMLSLTCIKAATVPSVLKDKATSSFGKAYIAGRIREVAGVWQGQSEVRFLLQIVQPKP